MNLVSLLKITLPSATIAICDGAFFTYAGDTYAAGDDTFGTIVAYESIAEGNGDELPLFKLTFVPADDAATEDLSDPEFQSAPLRFYIAEYNPATGAIVGTPELTFDGQLDRTILNFDRNVRSVEMEVVTTAERLILKNASNTMTPRFHKSLWPGETGHDNAVDLEIPIAWGVESASRSGSGSTGQGFGGGILRPGGRVAEF